MPDGAMTAILGAVAGGIISLLSVSYTKRLERKSQIHRLITEKRILAYDELIAVAQAGANGMTVLENQVPVNIPHVFRTSEDYQEWFDELIRVYSRVAHLIDKSVAGKLHLWHVYIHTLDDRALERVQDIDDPDRRQRAMHEIGAVVFGDFQSIGGDVVRLSAEFFRKDIYRWDYLPSTLGREEQYEASHLSSKALFTEYGKIRAIITKYAN